MDSENSELAELQQEVGMLRSKLTARDAEIARLKNRIQYVRSMSISYETLREYMKSDKLMQEIKATLDSESEARNAVE